MEAYRSFVDVCGDKIGKWGYVAVNWLLSNVVSSEWRSMTRECVCGQTLNIPLTVLVLVVLLALAFILGYLFSGVVYRYAWRDGWSEGYEDGVCNHVIKRGKITLYKDAEQATLVFTVDQRVYEKAKEDALKEAEERA